MKVIVALLALICLSSAVFTGHRNPRSEPIPGIYIFQFNPNSSHSARQTFLTNFAGIPDHKIRFEWTIGDFHAFSAETNPAFVNLYKESDLFSFIDTDYTVHALQAECVTQSGATWGIDRISERAIELDGDYEYKYNASNVDAYIIDTGIYLAHNEFTGRVTWGATFTGDNNNNDCNGHGTHVAGTVGGTVYGVAKKVSLIAVKVLNCGGSGSWEGVINGVNWVAQQYNSKGKKPSVANMSLGGGLYPALNNAVDAAVRAGVVFVVAGGNSNADACNFSPAATPSAITVGSTDVTVLGDDQQDIRSSFSNFGKCTDMWAPGSMITAAWIGNPTATRTISGTSMASPHVCGVAALQLQANPSATPAQVEAALNDASTKGVINLNCRGAPCTDSPNRMIYSAC